jgi:hypothetical protein
MDDLLRLLALLALPVLAALLRQRWPTECAADRRIPDSTPR